MDFKVGDYVLTTFKDWYDKGFKEPRRIYSIKNECCNLGKDFTSCHFSHLKKATEFKIKPFEEIEITLIFNTKTETSIIFRFDKIDGIVGLN